MKITEFESRLNHWGQERAPFLFLVDFEMERAVAWKTPEIPPHILFSVPGFSNTLPQPRNRNVLLNKYPIPFSEYQSRFKIVKDHIDVGDSYLANLTVKTKIDVNLSLEELFFDSDAKYKICWKNQFLVFSPETFVRITGGKIYGFPMKGTIDAALPDAAQRILSDEKELSEHVTIVDLIRNDLSTVASAVAVNRFRYVEKIRTRQKHLLQVSSEIAGKVTEGYSNRIGSILVALLPAGSVSGAPKRKTLQIIREAEEEKRGWYTGVFGYFDGENLDSSVMIRFIEQEGNDFYYRSGGGITARSNAMMEYQEVIDKIYVPVD